MGTSVKVRVGPFFLDIENLYWFRATILTVFSTLRMKKKRKQISLERSTSIKKQEQRKNFAILFYFSFNPFVFNNKSLVLQRQNTREKGGGDRI